MYKIKMELALTPWWFRRPPPQYISQAVQIYNS